MSRVIKYQDDNDSKITAAKKLLDSIKSEYKDYQRKLTAGKNILPKMNYKEALDFVYKIALENKSELQI